MSNSWQYVSLVQAMVGSQTGDKPLSEPMMTQFTGAFVHHPPTSMN